MIESQKGEIYRAHQGDERLRRDQQLLHVQSLEQNRDLREAHEKSLNEMEELKRFQGSTFDTISRRKLIEDRDTILELTGKIQELQNEINCMYALDNPTLPVNQCFSHLIQILVECYAVLWECQAAKMGRTVFGTHMVFRETFLQIQQRLLQHLTHGVLMYQNTHHHRWWVKAKHQLRIRDASQDRQPEIQSSLVREHFSKNYGADQ